MPTVLDFIEALKIPLNRANDLAERAAAGGLTEIETLAAMILRGGDLGEATSQGVIEKAIEAYNYGGYRIPVRVIADWQKCFAVLSVPRVLSGAARDRIHAELAAMMARSRMDSNVVVVDSGSKLDFYEVTHYPEERAIVKNVQPEQNGDE